jgi:hypothetical protein
MMSLGEPASAHAGALQILRYRYATEIARRRPERFNFSFATTREILRQLHQNVKIDVLLAAFESLQTPGGEARPKGLKPAPEILAWRGASPALRRIKIRNFKAIQELDLEIAERRRESSSAGCMMLLGENATGKTSILEAITLALVGEKTANSLGLRPRDYVHRHHGPAGPTEVIVEFYEAPSAELRVSEDGTRFEGTEGPSANVLAYGSRRFFLRGRRRRAKSGGVRGMFDPMWVLPHPDLWLGTLDDLRFNQVVRAMRDVLTLPDESELRREPDVGILIETRGDEVPIALCSRPRRTSCAAWSARRRTCMKRAVSFSLTSWKRTSTPAGSCG